ncbi:ATP-dependent DNA helicase Q-like SIM-like protein [Corchorus olitorius]|uniref:ATP-dependent DNA helicase Q-like SIM-like protein n=1 Tax=Corchorus olitorius TaxID=93759 RepID=A0A1R3GMR8_9ROSI|nr:ATP-dependent DNA helicase Q-like SIM-like protein [Corchorus olitorius]
MNQLQTPKIVISGSLLPCLAALHPQMHQAELHSKHSPFPHIKEDICLGREELKVTEIRKKDKGGSVGFQKEGDDEKDDKEGGREQLGALSGATPKMHSRQQSRHGSCETQPLRWPAHPVRQLDFMYFRATSVPNPLQVYYSEELDIGSNWEPKVNSLLRKHLGYSSLKSFQKEALAAWLSHQDRLVLAAIGSA